MLQLYLLVVAVVGRDNSAAAGSCSVNFRRVRSSSSCRSVSSGDVAIVVVVVVVILEVVVGVVEVVV